MIKTIGIDKNITITDKVQFILTTTNSEGCLANPYKINKATIYFISREFAETSVSEYANEIYDSKLAKEYEELKSLSCVSPTKENIDKLNSKKQQLNNSKIISPFFFKEAVPIKTFGGYSDEQIGVQDLLLDPHGHDLKKKEPYESEFFPAWLNPDLVPAEVKSKVEKENTLVQLEENGLLASGKFVLSWDPIGCREGDYFICWSWSPNLAGDELSAHMMFSLGADTSITTSIPAHRTRKNKYEILMERYLPQMFKNIISEQDLTPYVLQELNLSIAKGFTFVEDMANQIIDLLDANCVHEQFIPLLSNLFNLKLKSNDPTLWRRQTKKAISNYKKKGSITGLRSALSDGGISLLGITKLWQVVSKYTFQEHFTKTESNKFKLKKNIILPIDPNNFKIWIREKNSNKWNLLNNNVVEFIEENFENYCIYLGELEEGDSIRLLYQTSIIPSEDAQNIEYYIQTLDIMDQRDERDQDYPLKNWNTRVIEETDPLFDIIIPIRHPIQDPTIWGKVRTEFPYSENVYNMEEYNGSTRDSFNPCDISKEFIDSCVDCQASSFIIDLEIEELSNDRILESQKIIEEFVPFHSIIHSINFIGSKNEFIKPPLEKIQILIQVSKEEILISGEAQHIFTRSVLREDRDLVRRNLLAQMEEKTSSLTGTAFNESIMLFAPGFNTKSDLENNNFKNKYSNFIKKNINTNHADSSPFENSNLLEILAPSANSGFYTVREVGKNLLKISLENINEPLNKSQFEFRVSNKIHEQTIEIQQNDLSIFSSETNLSEIKIISKKDIENGFEATSPHRIKFNENEYYEFDILETLPDNKFIIKGPLNSDEFSIPSIELDWEIINPINNEIIKKGKKGKVSFVKRGLIDLGPEQDKNKDEIKIGDYLLYNGSQYKIKKISDEYKFFIENYSGGDVGGVEAIIYRRVIENCVGQLDYKGLMLQTLVDYEADLGIQNGKNSSQILTKSNNLKENYLILIDSNYYSILDIDENTIILDGPSKDWTTLGTSVNFSIFKFIKQSLTIPESKNPKIPGYNFEQINRQNNEIIEKQITTVNSLLTSKILNSTSLSKNEFIDCSEQSESINFNIEYKKEGENENETK